MLKLPEKFPRLEDPHFILANPESLQLTVLVVILLALPLALLGWVANVVLAGEAGSSHYAAAAIMALVLTGGLYPRNWRRWVTFAADRRGVYLGSFGGDFHHVPWADVGASSIGVAGIGSNRQRTVILMLRVDDATWAALLGGRKRRVNAPADEHGFRPFGIGNAARNVDETRRQIEQLRPAS